jgi:O-antigen/teichoic acid export membrane protein
MRLALQIALPVGLIGSFTAWRLLPRIPGLGGFDGAGVALSILSSAAAFIFVASIAQGILISAHLQRRLLVIAAWGFAVNLALNVALIPRYSYVGAAIATSVTEAIVAVFSIRALRNRLGLVWADRRLVRTAVPCAALTATLLVGFTIPVEAQIVAGVAAYGIAAVAVGLVTADDLRIFLPQPGRRRQAGVEPRAPRT